MSAVSEATPQPRGGLSLVQGGSLAEHLSKDDTGTMAAIVLPWKFNLEEGGELMDGVVVGKFLGAGMQARVYRLQTKDGKPLGKVLKVNRADVGSQMLNNNRVWVGMDKEWKVGTQVRIALQEPDGRLPGFMTVHESILHKAETSDGRVSQVRFAGMVLGELRGWEVYKRMEAPEFHNIAYVKEMLFQVFSALDRAQRKLGFDHADLGMRNVMEHYPRTWEEMPDGAEAAAQVPRIPGYTCNGDGSRLPLGPEVEFKIIDYGLSKMSPKLAVAAGGREARETLARMQTIFGQGHRIVFEGKSQKSTLEMETGGEEQESRGWLRRLCACGRESDQQFKLLRETTKPALNGAGSQPLASEPSGDLEPQRFAVQAPHQLGYSEEEVDRAAKWARVTRKKSPIEKIYRSFWHRKGDVFHILLTIAMALDNRVWPAEDTDDVEALVSLVHHVTGIQLTASFAKEGQGKAGRSLFGSLVCGSRPQVVEDEENGGGSTYHVGKRAAFCSSLKRHWFRFKAHVTPYNSGLLAGEALVHPLFRSYRSCQPPHASKPATLGKLFPAAAPGQAGEAVAQPVGGGAKEAEAAVAAA